MTIEISHIWIEAISDTSMWCYRMIYENQALTVVAVVVAEDVVENLTECEDVQRRVKRELAVLHTDAIQKREKLRSQERFRTVAGSGSRMMNITTNVA